MTVLTVADKPARAVLVDLVRPLVPKQWVLVDDESAQPDEQRTRVRFAQRKIAPGALGSARVHLVTFQATITVPGDTLSDSEKRLDDDLDAFLFALDSANIPWTEATKGRYADENNRLGYSLEITIYTNPAEESNH